MVLAGIIHQKRKRRREFSTKKEKEKQFVTVANIGSHLPCTPGLHPTAPALLYLPPPPPDFTSVTSTDNSQRSINSSISRFSSSQMRPTRVSLLRVFLFSSFFFSKEQVLLYLSCGRWRITQALGPRDQEILPSHRTLTNEDEPTLDLPRRRRRQGKNPWLSTE